MRSLLKTNRSDWSARALHGGFRKKKFASSIHADFMERPRGSKLHGKRQPLIRDKEAAIANDGFHTGPNSEARAIVQQVQTLSVDELHARYHELIDQRLEQTLKYTERFELERIESRLDAMSMDDLDHVAAARRGWEQDRAELVDSLERLLTDLRAVH